MSLLILAYRLYFYEVLYGNRHGKDNGSIRLTLSFIVFTQFRKNLVNHPKSLLTDTSILAILDIMVECNYFDFVVCLPELCITEPFFKNLKPFSCRWPNVKHIKHESVRTTIWNFPTQSRNLRTFLHEKLSVMHCKKHSRVQHNKNCLSNMSSSSDIVDFAKLSFA